MNPSPYLLLTPGPVAVPSFVREAISQQTMQHHSQAFYDFYEAFLNKLKYLFQTQQTTLAMIGNGSMGMEALISSLFWEQDKVLVVSMGKFSKRWANYVRLLGLNLLEIEINWGKTVSPEQILQVLEKETEVKGMILTHCETSTGALLDIEEIVFAVKQKYPSILAVVDAISLVGALPFYFDDWKIDAAVVAAQKALMNPTGTCYFALSEQAVAQLQPSDAGDARNLYNYYHAAQKNSYPYSPPVQLFYGVNAVLDYMINKKLPVIWNETLVASRTFKKFVLENKGLIWSELPSDSLTTFSFPDQDMTQLKAACIANGVEMSGGQDDWKGKIMRISHLGLYDTSVITKAMEVILHNINLKKY